MNNQNIYAHLAIALGKTKAAPSEISTVVTKHAFRDLYFVDLTYPEGKLRVAIHDKFSKAIKARLEKFDVGFLDEGLLDDEFKPKLYRGSYIMHPYHFKANIVQVPCDLQAVTPLPDLDGLYTGDFERFDDRLTAMAKKQAVLFTAIHDQNKAWLANTKTPRIGDLYWSFDVVDHKIHFCLDHVPAISEVGVTVDRTAVTPDIIASYPEEDQEHINAIMTLVERLNADIDELRATLTHPFLKEWAEGLMDRAYFQPLYQQVHIVIPFSDTTPEGKKLVEEEVSRMLDTIRHVSETCGKPVYLDLTAMMLFSDQDGEKELLADQVINNRFGCFIESFGNAVQVAMLKTDTPLFRPYAKFTPVDNDAKNVIDTKGDLIVKA